MAKDNLETNPITIKPETASHAAEQFSWVPLPYCSPPRCPFTIKPETMSHAAEQFPWVPLTYCSLPGHPVPIKSLALSAHVSPWIIHFLVLDKSAVSGPGRGPPSCNRTRYKTLANMFSDSTLQPALRKLPAVKSGYSVEEE